MVQRAFFHVATGSFANGLLSRSQVYTKRHNVQINTYPVAVPNLPASFEGFTIVHLTDLHFGPFVSIPYLESVVEQALSLPRDLIVCTGDYIHEREGNWQINRIWPLLSTLHAPDGVFSVLGNHDHWGDADGSMKWLERTGQNLRHRCESIVRNGERLWLAGAGDLWEDHKALDEIMDEIPTNECRIVLAHNPDTADTHFENRVDLMISGHTHGGQVRFRHRAPPILPVRNRNYSSGLKTSKKGFPLYISCGIGWGGVPIRINTPPEIAILKLTRAL